MRALLLVPAVLSALLLGAHLMRAGWLPLAIAVALSPLLLFVRGGRGVVVLQVALAAAALEWLRALFVLVGVRQAAGQPYLRLSLILGAVALLAALSVPLLGRWRRRPRAVTP